MLTDAATGTDGGSRYLDDGVGANASTISQIEITTSSKAQDAIAIIDRALQDVATERAELGAVSNRLDHTISNLGNIVVNTEASQSRIEDADFAAETGNLTKAQILSQAATAMLAQANASKQSVLSLLQG
jgi:flagellin